MCQFVSGTLRTSIAAGAGASSILDPTYVNDVELFITRYIGFGFTFVLAGVIVAKYEDKFLRSPIGPLLLPAVVLTLLETVLLLRFAEWTTEYKLAFSILPNTILAFYGILCIKSQVVQSYHKVINLFSIVTFFGHILFMKLNLLVLNWDLTGTTVVQDMIYLALTFVECVAVTAILRLSGKYLPLRREITTS